MNAAKTIILQNASIIIMLSILLAESPLVQGYFLIPIVVMVISQIGVIVNCWGAA